ncbi:MAG: hypothetical protein ACYDGN_05835 [Acidimicrobiales bacterium]
MVAYKGSRSNQARERAAAALAGVAAQWWTAHHACVNPKAADLMVVPVPSSTGGRQSWNGCHPLDTLYRRVLDEHPIAGLGVRSILVPGVSPPSRLKPGTDGFGVSACVTGRRAIVVDDLFVSGARTMSAAAALEAAGAYVEAIVPLARLVRPDHNRATAAFWAHYGRLAASRSWCPRCAPARSSIQPLACRGMVVQSRTALVQGRASSAA